MNNGSISERVGVRSDLLPRGARLSLPLSYAGNTGMSPGRLKVWHSRCKVLKMAGVRGGEELQRDLTSPVWQGFIQNLGIPLEVTVREEKRCNIM